MRRLFLIVCSQILYDEMSHPQNLQANYLFNVVLINVFNGESDFAVMRNKGKSFNSVDGESSELKQLIVLFAILGFPVSIII